MPNLPRFVNRFYCSLLPERAATALREAARRGEIEQFKKVIEAGAAFAHDEMSRRVTPMSVAAQFGRKNMVEFLIAKGANVNSVDHDGGTSLHAAAKRDLGGMVEFLLANGADVNATDNSGWTPLHGAGAKYSVAELLLANGAKTNACTQEGGTHLHYARRRDVAQLLLSNSAEINARTKRGWTPLHYVVIALEWEASQTILKSWSYSWVIGFKSTP